MVPIDALSIDGCYRLTKPGQTSLLPKALVPRISTKYFAGSSEEIRG